MQAILVIRLPDGGYEIVFGHRRHRACLDLGLPIKAVVWGGSVDDTELILIQDAENRCRTNPSVLDQGRMYAALTGKGGKEKVFESERALARAFGISHTWVRKAMSVAELPDQIVAAFEDPARIQPDHAQKIAKALKSSEGKAVLRRAAALTAQESPRTAAQVVDCLLGQGKGADAGQLKHGQQLLGSWKRDGKGRVVITLERTFSSPEVLCKVAALLGSLSVSDGVET